MQEIMRRERALDRKFSQALTQNFDYINRRKHASLNLHNSQFPIQCLRNSRLHHVKANIKMT